MISYLLDDSDAHDSTLVYHLKGCGLLDGDGRQYLTGTVSIVQESDSKKAMRTRAYSRASADTNFAIRLAENATERRFLRASNASRKYRHDWLKNHFKPFTGEDCVGVLTWTSSAAHKVDL